METHSTFGIFAYIYREHGYRDILDLCLCFIAKNIYWVWEPHKLYWKYDVLSSQAKIKTRYSRSII